MPSVPPNRKTNVVMYLHRPFSSAWLSGHDGRVDRRRLSLGVIAPLALVVGVLVLLSYFKDALDQADKLASVGGSLVGAAGLVIASRVRGGRTEYQHVELEQRLRQAAEDLARQVGRQQEQETDIRLLAHPRPLAVQWTSTARPVASASSETTSDKASWARSRRPLHGDTGTLADVFNELPAGQLVILGEPGSGKTSAAVVLTATLIERRQSDDPVPVLLSLSSWDPMTVDLETWIVHRISAQYPAFHHDGRHGPGLARELLEAGMVLPVLDGLDEITVVVRVIALRGIARAMGAMRPVILTSRSEEYEQAIRVIGFPLGRAVVVELEAITADAAAVYLSDGWPDGDRRWEPIAAVLRHRPDSVLTRTLSTPLMVYLAKTAFAPTDTDPTDLLTPQTGAELERMLFDAYIPALYAAEHQVSGERQASIEDIADSFAFLARRLGARPEADLSWGRLFLLLPQPQVVVSAVKGAAAAACLALVFLLPIVFTAVAESDSVASVFAVAVGLVDVVSLAVVVGAVIGALVGLAMRAMVGGAHDDERLVPLPKIVSVNRRELLGQVIFLVPVGALFGPVMFPNVPRSVGVGGGMLVILIAVCNLGLTQRVPSDSQLDPRESLASDRNTAFILALTTFAGITALITFLGVVGADVDLADVLRVSTIMAVLMVFLFPLSCAWTKYTIARVLFGLLRRTPWHLLDFLEHAQERGVLRRVGATYQFRHQRLQQYFASL